MNKGFPKVGSGASGSTKSLSKHNKKPVNQLFTGFLFFEIGHLFYPYIRILRHFFKLVIAVKTRNTGAL